MTWTVVIFWGSALHSNWHQTSQPNVSCRRTREFKEKRNNAWLAWHIVYRVARSENSIGHSPGILYLISFGTCFRLKFCTHLSNTMWLTYLACACARTIRRSSHEIDFHLSGAIIQCPLTWWCYCCWCRWCGWRRTVLAIALLSLYTHARGMRKHFRCVCACLCAAFPLRLFLDCFRITVQFVAKWICHSAFRCCSQFVVVVFSFCANKIILSFQSQQQTTAAIHCACQCPPQCTQFHPKLFTRAHKTRPTIKKHRDIWNARVKRLAGQFWATSQSNSAAIDGKNKYSLC